MTRRLVALALLGVASLAWLAQATPEPILTPADAVRWEGQSVSIRGVVRDRRVLDDGVRFDLVLDGHALAVRFDGPGTPDGAHVEVDGRLARLGGVLTLLADRLTVIPLDAPLSVSLSALARDPGLWQDQVVTVRGTVEDGHLRGDGHRVALGRGAWPPHGTVSVEVLLTYDAKCACHRLDRVGA